MDECVKCVHALHGYVSPRSFSAFILGYVIFEDHDNGYAKIMFNDFDYHVLYRVNDTLECISFDF